MGVFDVNWQYEHILGLQKGGPAQPPWYAGEMLGLDVVPDHIRSVINNHMPKTSDNLSLVFCDNLLDLCGGRKISVEIYFCFSDLTITMFCDT